MRKKNLLFTPTALLLLLGSSLGTPLSTAHAIVPDSTIYDPLLQQYLTVVDYEAVPVANAWDYGVWDKAANGSRLGSLNDVANQFLYITHEVTVNNTPMVYFTSNTLSGFVAKEAIIPGAWISGVEKKPVQNAADYGIWSHFRNGHFIANLSSYQDRWLTVEYVFDNWAFVSSDGKSLGWVSVKGLQDETTVHPVHYYAFPVNEAWDYGVWSHPQGGERLTSLNDARHEILVVSQEAYVDGTVKVFVASESISGWVAKAAIRQGGAHLFNIRATPKQDAWNFGIWSHFEGGVYVGSLDDFYGEELTAPIIAPNDFVLIQYEGQPLGWVHVNGLGFLDEAFSEYTGYPVQNAWDYSVWSELRNGQRLGSLNDYAGQELTVISLSLDGTMVKFRYGDTVIGWVDAMAIVRN